MKKILASFAVLTISGLVTNPIITTIYSSKLKQKNITNSNNDTNNYVPYQSQAAWENYLHKNKAFISFIKSLEGLNDDYIYQKSNIKLNTIKDTKTNNNQPIGTLLMNGKIQTTVGNPDMASQHIIDNSKGTNAITIDYDSKIVTTTATVSATFSESFSLSMTAEEKIGIPFDNASLSTTLSFNTSISFSSAVSTEEAVTFDKFSTTVKPGDKEEVDYVVMQNKQVFNMVLKAQLDINACNFVFVNKHDSQDIKLVSWNQLAKNEQINQPFAKAISDSLSPSEIKNNVQPFISVDKFNDPTIPVQSQFYNPNIMFIYLPLSFAVDGYSTLITQTKL